MIADCYQASETSFESYVAQMRPEMEASASSSHTVLLIPTSHLGFPFGRDKFTLDELLPEVPDAFKYLKRGHFNRTRKEIKVKIGLEADVAILVNLGIQFHAMNYDERVSRWVKDRLNYLVPSARAQAETVVELSIIPYCSSTAS